MKNKNMLEFGPGLLKESCQASTAMSRVLYQNKFAAMDSTCLILRHRRVELGRTLSALSTLSTLSTLISVILFAGNCQINIREL